MTQVTIETIEGHEITLDQADFDILDSLPGVDMTRLCVIGDEVHAMKRGTDEPHIRSLEQMLSQATEAALLKAPTLAPVAVAEGFKLAPSGAVIPEVKPEVAKRSKKLTAAGASLTQSSELRAPPALPKAGQPRAGGVLDRFVHGGGRIPPVKRPDGTLFYAKPDVSAGRAKVTLIDHDLNLKGYAYLPAESFHTLSRTRHRPDTLMWRLDSEGHPVTRIRRSPTDTYPQRVADLLGELGLDPTQLKTELCI